MSPPGRPRGFRRDRDCLTCKARGIKCDLNRPICAPCREANIHCRGYRNRLRWATTSTLRQASQYAHGGQQNAGSSKPSRVSSVSGPPIGQNTSLALSLSHGDPHNDANWATHHEQFLDFFELKFEQAVGSLGQAGAPVKMSLAGVWRLFRQRVFRGRDASGHNGLVEHLRLQLDAVRGLGNAIKDGDILAIFGVVTLGFLDVYEGPFGDWQGHVRGAKALVTHVCPSDLEMHAWCCRVPGFRQVISLAMWWDLWNAFLNTGRVLTFTDQQRACMDPEFFDLVDCPPDTFSLFVQVVQSIASGEPLDLPVVISDQLLHLTKDETNLSSKTKDAWRYASVMAALAPGCTPQNTTRGALVQSLGDNICRIARSVPPLSGRYRMLSGPIAVLGATSNIPSHVQAVELYWSVCDSLRQPIYPHGRDIRPCIQSRITA